MEERMKIWIFWSVWGPVLTWKKKKEKKKEEKEERGGEKKKSEWSEWRGVGVEKKSSLLKRGKKAKERKKKREKVEKSKRWLWRVKRKGKKV